MLPEPVLVEPEHRRLLRQSVRAFVARRSSAADVRARRRLASGYDDAVWREMAEAGWLMLGVSEAEGGLGLGLADVAALHEELGKAANPEPAIAVAILAGGILQAGESGVLRQTLLPSLMAGELIATLAWQGGVTRSNGHAPIGPSAISSGAGYRINGSASFVPAAMAADALIVAAATSGGVILAYMPSDMPGIVTSARAGADYAPLATIEFQDVEIGLDRLIAGPAMGQKILEGALDRARVAICAEAVGVMHRTVEMSIDYLNMREQFGRPIGSFQALQHRTVDLYTLLELARSATMRAAVAVDQQRSDAAVLVAAAKARCSEAGPRIAGQAIHLHGTIGFTEDLDLSLYIRRAHALSPWLGNGEASLSRFIELGGAIGR